MHVYIFKCGSEYKIGKADDVAKRQIQVEKDKGSKVVIYAWRVVENPFQFESYLHKKYKLFRTEGEWFSISKAQVHDIIQKYCFTVSIETIMSSLFSNGRFIDNGNSWLIVKNEINELKEKFWNVSREEQKDILDEIYTLKIALDHLNNPLDCQFSELID